MRRTILAAAGLAFLALAAAAPIRPVRARGHEDQDQARAALAAGEIRPLADILALVEQRCLGRVIEVELDREDGAWVYELKLLPPSGRVFMIELDASTAALRRGRGPVQERP